MPVCYAYLGRKTGVAVCLQNGMPWVLLLTCECPFGLHAETKRTTLEHASMYFAREKLAQASCSSDALNTCAGAGADHSSRLMHTQSALSTLIMHAVVSSVKTLKVVAVTKRMPV